MRIPMRMMLIAEEAKQKIQAEIADLQAQLLEIDTFLTGEAAETAPVPVVKNVPRGENQPLQSTNEQRAVTMAAPPPPPPQYTGEVFNSDDYTEAGKNLPEKFDTKKLREIVGVNERGARTLLQVWMRREWIVRVRFGRYQRTAIFGVAAPLAHLPLEVLPPVPPVTVDVSKLAQLNQKLNDLQKQHDDCVDGSVQQEILADQIETLEAEIGQLESR